MNPLSLAKLRGSRRRQEAGAALFVVAMTLAVLASVGVYALAASANEVRTSGYERTSTQTHYMASYGVLGTTHEIVASKAQFYLGLMMSQPDSPCVSLPNLPTSPPPSILTSACRRLGSAELGQPWTGASITQAYGGTVPFQQGQSPGSFGPTPTKGDFFVELTEPNQSMNAAGYSDHFCFIRLTASSNGLTQPVFPSNVNVSSQSAQTETYAGEGIEVQRARILAGPVQCPR